MARKEWRTQYDGRKRVHADHGNRMHKLYGAAFDDSGRIYLEEKGEESIYEHIQSFADSVDIHVILKRFANGESDVLSKVQGFYGDYTQLPTNYAELLNTVNAGEGLFNSIPVEVRAKFGHSFNEFMTALCDGTLKDMLGIEEPSPADSEPFPADPEPSPAAE